MSEYQAYEFLAVDHPLTAKQMTALRRISSRAELSPTRFWNEYHWGDLKADPAKLTERYFDAHLYFADWGTRRLILRIPKVRVDLAALESYVVGTDTAHLLVSEEHVLLDLSSTRESEEYDDDPDVSLAALSQLRAELMSGDLRPAYLAWLLAVVAYDIDDADEEPPVPAGLAELTAAQEAMVAFLRIDVDLVSMAASRSAASADDGPPFRRWVAARPAKEKDAWLRRAAEAPDMAIGGELLRAFRATLQVGGPGARRTAGDLRALAETRRTQREKTEAARAKKAKTAAEAARQRRLAKIAVDVETAWTKLEELVASKEYDDALKLAVDLRDVATRAAEAGVFATRFEALRKRQLRRRGFFDQWKRANKTR